MACGLSSRLYHHVFRLEWVRNNTIAEQGLCLLCLPSCWVAILVPRAGKKFARDAVRTVLVMHDLDDNDHITSPRRSEPFRNSSSTGKYYQKARSSMEEEIHYVHTASKGL